MTGRSSPHVMHVVLSLEAGGTERLVVDIANESVTRGVTSLVCCLDATGLLARDLDARVQVYLVKRTPRLSLATALRIALLAKRVGATVLHCHQYTPFVYGCLARLFFPRLRMVFTEHGRLANATISRRRTLANRILTRVGGAQFAVSEELRRFMLAEGFSESRLAVLHNGVSAHRNCAALPRPVARQRLGLADSDFVVGTIARFDPVKDLPTLVEACSIAARTVPALRLVLIGDGPSREAVDSAFRSFGGPPLVLPGLVADARNYLPAFDVYVNSSISEGISISILEAMAESLPIVATAVGGTPEIIRNRKEGLLVPPRDPVAIATALTELATYPQLRADVSDGARQRMAEAFSADRMVSSYVEVYSQ